MTTRRRVTAKDGAAAIAMLDSQRRAVARPASEPAPTLRCIGSAKFGIEAHDAPPADFPVQPSQKDGLGRMCKTHWTEYVRGLTRDAKAGKGAEAVVATIAAEVAAAPGIFTSSGPRQQRRTRKTEGEQIVDAVDDAIARLVASEAARETPAVTTRRAKFEAKLAEVGVASDEGQRILETTEEAVAETDRKGG